MRLLVLCLALAACRSVEPDVVPDADTAPRVRLATFNVRRLFDTICDSGACQPGDFEELPSASDLDARATQIANAIRALDADVVALQEIETQACLDALLARLSDVMPHGVLGEIHSAGSVDVAVLSRTPIETINGYRDTHPLARSDGSATTFSRELLEVHLHATNGAAIIMFAAHFRSKVNDDPGRRLAEARATGEIISAVAAEAPDALVVLGGDLNDTPDSAPLLALTVDGGLIRVADDLPASAQATYRYAGNGQAIDHLLLAPTQAAARVARSSQVWTDSSGYGGSDHDALTSEFRAR